MFWYLISAAIILAFYYLLIRPFSYWKNLGVPQYNFLTTICENILGLIPIRSFPDDIKKLYDDFSGARYCGVYQFDKAAFVIRDTELLKEIMVKDFDHFVDHMKIVPDNSEPMWEKNLLALEGEKWKDMRGLLSPSFTSSKMKIMFTLISDYAKQFLAYLEKHSIEFESVEIRDVFSRFSNDVIATTAFGYNCDSFADRENKFYLMGKDISSFQGKTLELWVGFLFPNLAKKLGLRLFSKKTTEYFTSLIKQNIETRENSGIIRPDMIHLLMEARKGREDFNKTDDSSLETDFTVIEGTLDKKEEKRNMSQLTDIDITAQALIFFFAGFDTVSTTMSFIAYELAINVEIQERLQAEIDDILQECSGKITYDTLSKMRYMDMVIAEGMRKWPAAIVTDRLCTKKYTIKPVKEGELPVTLHPGQIIWIPMFGIQRDPNIYRDPDRFDPERFNKENKSKLTSYEFFPFGVGPRACIGNRFALMEIKILFTSVLSKFNITVTDKTKIPIEFDKSSFQLNCKGGIWLGLRRRTGM